MNRVKHYYLHRFVQVQMDRRNHGSGVLLDDAAFFHSPISGVMSGGFLPARTKLTVVQGAVFTIIRAYTLAVEVSWNQHDI